MDMILEKQYNLFSQKFSEKYNEKDKASKRYFYDHLPHIKGRQVLDLGCGDGYDAAKYHSLGALVAGVDASEEMLKLARFKNPELQFEVGTFDTVPFPNKSFDFVFSKYAIQTARNLQPIWTEVERVLITKGIFMYLVVHPIRQLYEKKKNGKNYFTQEIVESIILQGSLTVQEPSHTLKEYFSPYVLEHFDILEFDEQFDHNAEKINDTYPGFMLVKLQKRN